MGSSGRLRGWWSVVGTKSLPGKEGASRIREQGIECYRPLFREPPRRGVRKVSPLFPGYLFAKVDAMSWKSVSHTRDVRRVLMAGAMPSRLPTIEIERIRSLENN